MRSRAPPSIAAGLPAVASRTSEPEFCADLDRVVHERFEGDRELPGQRSRSGAYFERRGVCELGLAPRWSHAAPRQTANDSIRG